VQCDTLCLWTAVVELEQHCGRRHTGLAASAKSRACLPRSNLTFVLKKQLLLVLEHNHQNKQVENPNG
jgi:hypothetical protein